MRIVILTNQELHHQYFCGYIAERHNVVGILHPKMRQLQRGHRINVLARTYGCLYTLLRMGSKLPTSVSGWNAAFENAEAETSYFPQASESYASFNRKRVFSDVDVDSKAGIQLLESLSPDVVINLGGAIYRENFIQACKLFLNYHSGISPIYNGAGTVNFAFSNGHPHLCGGTLMTMNTVIDGGTVLAHYLPAIEAVDTPATLSMKTYAGAPIVYDRFLTNLAKGSSFAGAPQHRPMFYAKGAHWTLYQTLLTKYHLKQNLVQKYLRAEKIVEYWSQPNNAQAESLLNRTLSSLLWGAT